MRIQEVVQFSSEIESNGVKIADTQIGTTHIKYNGIDDVTSDNVFANYRGWNGTGQNCDARGYDTGNYFAVGNIYAPIIDARKFSVAPGEGEGPDDYKIYLDGWAVCEGGIDRYVYSADGGKIWHDMTFTGTNVMADRTVKNNPTSNSDITVSGWTYAEYGVEQKLNQQTIYDNAKSEFVTFDETDGANCNFEGLALCADLKPYKNQPDLDIIIAAVPATNANLRCEILRIMNYHSSNYYVSQVEAITSDIVSSKGKIEMTPDNKLLAITNGTSGNASEGEGWVITDAATGAFRYKEGTWYSDYYPTSYRGVMAHINAISAPIRYDNIATMASDIPIKTTLKIKGYMLCGYGVYGYAYSVDGGKSWIDIEDAKATTYASNDYGTNKNTKYEKLLYKWITHSDSVDRNYFAYNGHKGKFDTDSTALAINLSAYEGQVVDVIVAAKPYSTSSAAEKSDIYLPITKIDNVAVYGNDGTFYTRLHHVVLDQSILAGDDTANYVPVSSAYPDGSLLAKTDKWSSLNIPKWSYTIFEPNNVNALESRLYNNEVNEMQSGGRVTIDGFVVCKGGVRQYKYSLDGGKTWTVINDAGANITDTTKSPDNSKSSMITEAQKSDSSFTSANDGAKGDYCCSYNGTPLAPNKEATRADFYEHALEFNLPALPAGAERNLLVVAETNKDKLIPVLHIKLKFKYADGNTMQYGYYRSTQKNSSFGKGCFNTDKEWSLYAGARTDENGNNYMFNRFTIPVTQEGEQQFTFTHRLFNQPNSVTTPKHLLYNDDKTPNKQSTTHRSAKITLTTTKTHYLEGEKIGLNFGIQYTNTSWSGGFGTVTAAIISEDWLNQNGRQHTLYSQKFAPSISGTAAKTITIDDIKVAAAGAIKTDENPTGVYSNGGLSKWALDLKAGKYSIVLIHRDPFYYEDGNTSKPVAYGLANILYNEDLRSKYLLAQVPIYIHSKDETVDFSVIHDEGEYTYFSDLSRQFTAEDRANNENIEHIYTLTDPFSNDDARGITATVNVTKEDVKRGYIVLDVDYTKLMVKNNHTKAECEAKYPLGNNTNNASHSDNLCVSRQKDNNSVFTKKVKGDVMYDFSKDIVHAGMYYHTHIDFGSNPLIPTEHLTALNVPFTSATSGYGTTSMKIPVSEAGTYDLSFSGYLGSAVMHKGYDHGTTTWNPPDNSGIKTLTINYSGAYMSLPKSVYVKGEDIPVSYYTKGSVIDSTKAFYPDGVKYNSPWIGIFEHNKSSDSPGDEIEAERYYVPPESKGLEYISTDDLEPGTYKIYLRDNSAMLFRNGGNTYWWEYDMVTPISITIVDPSENKLDFSQQCSFYQVGFGGTHLSESYISIDKTVFFQEDNIHVNIDPNLAKSDKNVWLGLYPKGEDLYVAWTWPYSPDSKLSQDIKTSGITNNTNTSSWGHPNVSGNYTVPAGEYTLYLLSGGSLASAQKAGNVYAAIDITILPKSMKDKVTGNTDMHTV